MQGVFISYRRDDSAGFAGALERELATRLGPEHVFMDIKDIEGGANFPIVIDQAIKSSEVVLILIGSRWLDARDEQGVRRLEQPEDFVRQEVARALQSRTRVIPVLLDGTRLPAANQLPEDLQPLTTREAVELRNSHWDEDLGQLLNAVRESIYTLDSTDAAEKRISKDFEPIPPSTWLIKAAYFLLALGAVFVIVGLALAINRIRFLERAQKADARVVNLLREADNDQEGTYLYRPQFEYTTPAGQTVRTTASVGSNPPTYHVGEVVPFLFDPSQPSNGIPDTFASRWGFAIVFGGVGLVMLIGSAIPFALRSRRRRRIRRLLKEGRAIMTAYHSVEQNSYIEVNGRHPFVLITQWRNPVSQEVVQFRSPALWEDPTLQAGDRMITVVVDPNNFHHYAMDLSFLYRAAGPRVRRL